jgi:hypothetical protein
MMRWRAREIFWDTMNLRRGKQDGNPGGTAVKYQKRTVRRNRFGGILDSVPRFIALAFEFVVSSFIRGLDWNKTRIRQRLPQGCPVAMRAVSIMRCYMAVHPLLWTIRLKVAF